MTLATMDEIRKADTVAIIDGNSLMHRAFHAVPLTMNAPDGRPTNACFGFIAMLIKLIEDFNPSAIVCAFDAGRPAFRMEALEQYKAQRPPMDPTLKEQFPMIDDLLVAMDIPVIRIQGWEGDDILGTLAQRGEQQDKDVLLVTGDKDAYQLATDRVSIVTTKKGISDVVIYGPDEVFDRYGVTPEQVPDFLGLKGDPSDNIPGVTGVGEKTAAKLLQDYGDLEGVFANGDRIHGKMGENIRGGKDAAMRSRVVATISRDVPIELDLDAVHFPSFDPVEVRSAFGKLRFNKLLDKVLELGGGLSAGLSDDATATDAAVLLGEAGSSALAISEPLFEGDAAMEHLTSIIERGEKVGVLADEGDGPTLFGDGMELYVACSDGVAHIERESMLDALALLVRKADMVCLDAKAVLKLVYPSDSSMPALVTHDELTSVRVFDEQVAAYLLDSSRKDISLDALLADQLSLTIPKLSPTQSLPAARAACVLALYGPMSKALADDGSKRVFDEIEMPLLPVLLSMERTGVAIDASVLDRLSQSTAASIDDLRTEIYRTAGEEFNIDSPKQLGQILFEKLKLPVIKKTKTGYSTDAKVLQDLEGVHPLPGLVIRYRELAKIKSTYIDVLPTLLLGDDKLHTTFHQTATATGRLSSSDPNLQNIPVRTDFGRQIREAFVPHGPDDVFLSADYSQIELRLLAHLSGDNGLIEAFLSGRDFHTATAARVFGVPEEAVDPQMRSRAKAVNFGIVYGQQAFGLATSLHCSYKDAQAMIDRYFDAYPRVRSYLDEIVEFARAKGYVSTMYGRKRHIPEISSHNAQMRAFGERTAMNHPMQGSAADIIKLAMVEVDRQLAESDIDARLCLQVHDELDFECAGDDAQRLGAMVSKIMSGVVKLDVPLEVSVAYARTWADAK